MWWDMFMIIFAAAMNVAVIQTIKLKLLRNSF